MSSRIVKDPRGKVIIIQWSAAVHAAPHFNNDASEALERMSLACSDPDAILPNHSNIRVQRAGNEVYRRHFADLNKHVVVPVKATTETHKVGAETVVNATVTLTCYATDQPATGRRTWTRSST